MDKQLMMHLFQLEMMVLVVELGFDAESNTVSIY